MTTNPKEKSTMTDLKWRKARACGASNTCVETARDERGVLVRDSADPDGGHLALTRREFAGLLAAIRREGRGD